MIKNLSTIELYGLKGFSPAVCGLIEGLYSKIQLPVFSRFYINEKTNLMPEFYQQELRNIPMACVFREHIDKILMIGESQVDEKFPDAVLENYKIQAFPVAVLNLNVKEFGNEKRLYITYGDFKYYLMSNNESAEIEEIKPAPDLMEKLFMCVDFRRERKTDGIIVTDPIELQILATCGWNKNNLSKFQSIVPFDVHSHNINVIYDSQEQEEMYRTEPPFLMYRTPIMINDSKVVECLYIPPDINTLITKGSNQYPSTSIIKVQNFYPHSEKHKIVKFVTHVLKIAVMLTMDAVSAIPIETQYKDEEDLSELYRACIRFMCLNHELKIRNKYNLAWNSVITEKHKELVIEELNILFDNLKEIKM